jgi:hypothetical protein
LVDSQGFGNCRARIIGSAHVFTSCPNGIVVIDAFHKLPTGQKLHTGRLVLTPVDPEQAPDRSALLAQLKALGLLGTALETVAGGFAAGPSLLDLIGFTGCAVHLDTDGATGDTYLHMRIEGPHPHAVLKHGRNTRPPRCPTCGAALAGWREQYSATPPGQPPLLRCARCGGEGQARDWDWRRHGGFGRIFVSVEEVFPGEGQPLPRLLAALEDLGTGPWHYFYIQE